MSGGRAIPHTEGEVELPDGRTLGYSEFGDPDGDAILWFHGTPGARLQVPPEVEIEGRTRGFRVITVERPGNGASTPHLYDTVADFAHDVAEFADARSVDRFACVGLSGGGPYVLGCAHELGDRVTVGAVLGGIGPVNGPEAAPSYTKMLSWFEPVLTMTREPLAEVFSRALKALVPVADQGLWVYMRFGPSSDRPVFDRPEMQDMFKTDIIGALEGGMRGPVYDIALFARHWGFSLADITVPVRFWQGDADLIVPFNHGEHQAGLIPDSKLFVRPGEGHFAGFTAVDAVLDEIEQTWSNRSKTAQIA